jgi:small-conductance mechanosensitive channel
MGILRSIFGDGSVVSPSAEPSELEPSESLSKSSSLSPSLSESASASPSEEYDGSDPLDSEPTDTIHQVLEKQRLTNDQLRQKLKQQQDTIESLLERMTMMEDQLDAIMTGAGDSAL